MTEAMSDSLAALLLPGKLEGFARESHARELLSIPRVVALEASRLRPPGFLRDSLCISQARRLRFPAPLRLIVLYHPAQYPLARALLAQYQDLELWYIPPAPEHLRAANESEKRDLLTLDELARERATQVLVASEHYVDDEALRARMRALGVINPHAFTPGRRSQWPKPSGRSPRRRSRFDG